MNLNDSARYCFGSFHMETGDTSKRQRSCETRSFRYDVIVGLWSVIKLYFICTKFYVKCLSSKLHSPHVSRQWDRLKIYSFRCWWKEKGKERCLNKIAADRKIDLFRLVLRHWWLNLPINSGVPLSAVIRTPGTSSCAKPKSISLISHEPLLTHTMFSGWMRKQDMVQRKWKPKDKNITSCWRENCLLTHSKRELYF